MGISITADGYLRELEELSRRAADLIGSYSKEQLTWRGPSEAFWSISDNVQHLGMTNRVYLSAIRDASASAPRLKDGGTRMLRTAGWLSTLFVKEMEPPVKRKSKAKLATLPDTLNGPADALEELLTSNEEIAKFVRQSETLDLNAVRFKNPFMPVLRFTAATGLLVLTAHERRHLWQAMEVSRKPGFPRAAQGAGR